MLIAGTGILLRQENILLEFGILGGVAANSLFFYWTAIVGLYGTIGAVFALLVWLLVLGRLIVYIALLERVRWTDAPAVT